MGKITSRNKIRVASLFSGCGGMDLGLVGGFNFLDNLYAKNPFEINYAIDNDPIACGVYNDNFEHPIICNDIRQLDISEVPEHDLLIGGFPCQSFSIVAQNPPRLGYKNENGKLFFEMYKILENKKPKYFIAENVKGLLSANQKQAFPLIIETFTKAGYFIKYKLLNASDYGVPQRRERVFIVGFRDKDAFEKFEFPIPTHVENKVALKTIIENEDTIESHYYFSDRAVQGLLNSNKKMNKGRAQDINLPSNTVGAHLAKVSLNSTDPVLKINGRYRMFTPKEVARIQSFPDTFKLHESKTKSYKVLGNAVPPVMMWHVTQSLLKAIQ